MNQTELKELTFKYMMPSICMLGVATNIINVVAFSDKKLKINIYVYMLVHSIGNLFYLLFSFGHFFMKYTLGMQKTHTKFISLYEGFIFLNLTTMIAIFLINIELFIAFKRLLIVVNYNLKFKLSFRSVILLFALAGFLLQLPNVFNQTIKSSHQHLESNLSNHSAKARAVLAAWLNKTQFISNSSIDKYYDSASQRFNQSMFYKFTYTFTMTFRGIIAPCSLLLINVIMAIKLRMRMKIKARLTANFEESK